jgi:hypothetical protein
VGVGVAVNAFNHRIRIRLSFSIAPSTGVFVGLVVLDATTVGVRVFVTVGVGVCVGDGVNVCVGVGVFVCASAATDTSIAKAASATTRISTFSMDFLLVSALRFYVAAA